MPDQNDKRGPQMSPQGQTYNGPERRRNQQNAERWTTQDRRKAQFNYNPGPSGM